MLLVALSSRGAYFESLSRVMGTSIVLFKVAAVKQKQKVTIVMLYTNRIQRKTEPDNAGRYTPGDLI